MFYKIILRTRVPSSKRDYEDLTALSADIDKLTGVIQREKDRDAASDSVESTNQTNREIAEMNNQREIDLFHEANFYNAQQASLNRDFDYAMSEISRDFNAKQAALDRDFQSAEAQKSRDWNAVDAQLQRAKNAGINPALVAGAMAGSTSSAMAGGAAASSTPVTGVPATASALPHLQSPQMQNKLPLYQTSLATQAEIGKMFSEITKNFSEAENIKSDTAQKNTFNKFQEDVIKAGLKKSEAETHKLYSETIQLDTSVKEIQARIKQIQVVCQNIDADTSGKDIENMYKGEMMSATINKLVQDAGWSKAGATALMYKLPLEMGVLRSQSALNYMQGAYYNSAKELNEHETARIDAVTSLIGVQGLQSLWNLYLSFQYDDKFKSAWLRSAEAGATQAEFNSSDVMMTINAVEDALNTIFNGVQAGATVYGAKSIGDLNKVRGMDIMNNMSPATKVQGFR